MKKQYFSAAILFFLIIVFIASINIFQRKDQSASIFPEQAVDTLIRPIEGEYQFQSQGSNFSTTYKADPGSDRAIRFSIKNSAVAFFTPALAQAAVRPEINGSSLTYPAVKPGLDLRYTAEPNRLLEEFIAADYRRALEWREISQTVELENIDEYRQENGGLTLISGGQTAAVIPRPVLYEAENREEKSYAIEYRIEKLADNKLKVAKYITEAGLAWLADPHRQYPIVIDLVIDNADTASDWVSSDTTLVTAAEETTIKQEGTGSVKFYPTGWYNDFSWPYRVKLTIEADNVDADLTDFPVYVDLNDLPAAFHSHVNQTDARDIRVTKSDGTTELAREVVFYTAASDTGELHFKYTGTLSGSTDTSVYIYYGNASASDYADDAAYGAENVWDSYYTGVHHLDNDDFTDSTATANDATNSLSTSDTGQIDDGRLINANGEYFYVPLSGYIHAQVNTIDFWYQNVGTPLSFSTFFNSSEGDNQAKFYRTNSDTTLTLNINGTTAQWTSLAINVFDDSWHHIAISFDTNNNTEDLVIDGAAQTQKTANQSDVDIGAYNLLIGTSTATGGNVMGIIDEFRVSNNTNRASTWISTQYKNQSSPGTFFNAFGSEETLTAQTATRTVSATDLSSYSTITYWVRSDRTGSFMRFQFGEAASSEQTNAITVSSADTWEQKTWDISGIASADRDAVTKYAFYVTDASADFDFYFDDIQANAPEPSPSPSPSAPAAGSFRFEGVKLEGVKIN